MDNNMRERVSLAAVAAILLGLTLTPVSFVAVPAFAQAQGARVALSAADRQTAAAFEKRVREYVDMRERLERERLPKLSKDAKPEEIERHKAAFQEMVRSAQ